MLDLLQTAPGCIAHSHTAQQVIGARQDCVLAARQQGLLAREAEGNSGGRLVVMHHDGAVIHAQRQQRPAVQLYLQHMLD